MCVWVGGEGVCGWVGGEGVCGWVMSLRLQHEGHEVSGGDSEFGPI